MVVYEESLGYHTFIVRSPEQEYWSSNYSGAYVILLKVARARASALSYGAESLV